MLFNLVRMTTATTGTGTITLGSAVAGHLSFAAAGVPDQYLVRYAIIDGSNSEIGIGRYNSTGTTLERLLVKASTNSGSKISVSGSGTEICITPDADAWQQAYLGFAGQVFTEYGYGISPNANTASSGAVVKLGNDAPWWWSTPFAYAPPYSQFHFRAGVNALATADEDFVCLAGYTSWATWMGAPSTTHVAFKYDRANRGANWWACAQDGGTETAVDTGIAVVADVFPKFVIQRVNSAAFDFYANGALVAQISTNIRAIDSDGGMGIGAMIYKIAGTANNAIICAAPQLKIG